MMLPVDEMRDLCTTLGVLASFRQLLPLYLTQLANAPLGVLAFAAAQLPPARSPATATATAHARADGAAEDNGASDKAPADLLLAIFAVCSPHAPGRSSSSLRVFAYLLAV